VEGHWLGTLKVGADESRLAVSFNKQASGPYAGAFRSDADRERRKIDAIHVEGLALHFTIKGTNAVFEGRLKEDGSQLVGQWKQNGGLHPLTFRRQAREPTFARPQEPKRPYPYREEEVAYAGPKAGVKWAGTLTLPPGKGPFPAVRLLSGARDSDRDNTANGHKPFLVLADHLTRRGIAVLRVDAQGVGGSSGGAVTSAMATDFFAEEALASIDYLKARKDIDPARIGLIGHGEGAILAPMVAARRRDVAFLVLLACRGLTGEENTYRVNDLLHQIGAADEKSRARTKRMWEVLCRIAREHKDGGTTFKKFEEAWEKELSRLADEGPGASNVKTSLWTMLVELLTPWSRFYLTYDPQPALREVSCPVLALTGEKDRNVPPKDNLRKVAQALKEGGNKDFTVKELPGLNYRFQTCKTGHPFEHGTIEETFAPAALELIGRWALQRFGPGGKK
jgi:fermentation-respiration switch protein FrsA (DUF1100 family)